MILEKEHATQNAELTENIPVFPVFPVFSVAG